jgi:hypothetical protein
VVVPFTIACGSCFFCERQLWSACDNSNPNAKMVEALYGYAGSGLFGYSHMMGGYAGGQAQYVRDPYADVGPMKVPDSLTDEQVLFLTDIFPTGYMAAENCNIQLGDIVGVGLRAGRTNGDCERPPVGCGPGDCHRLCAADVAVDSKFKESDDVGQSLRFTAGERAKTRFKSGHCDKRDG